MTVLINSRALQVEQEIKDLDDMVNTLCDLLKYAKSNEEIDVMVNAIKEQKNKASIARKDLELMLQEAKKVTKKK